MKRLSIVMLAAVFAFPAMGQVKSLNVESQQKKIAKSDEEVVNPKYATNPKSWFNRGELFRKLFSENTEGLWMGMTKTEVRLIIGDAKEKREEKVGSATYDVQSYPNKDLYFEQDKLMLWKQTNIPDPDLLFKSKEAFEKTTELDEKGKFTKKVNSELTALSDQMRSEGLCAYNLQDYKTAQRYFSASADCKLKTGVVDSIMLYYAGVVMLDNLNDAANALPYFKLCEEHQYYDRGNVCIKLAVAYAGVKDTAAQEKALKEGFMKFPTNKDILVELINFYISSSEDPVKIIDLLKQAEANDPNNASLYFVEGTLYEKIGKNEDAMLSYQKSTEIDPKYFNGYYNIGALHWNQAGEYIKESSAIKDWKSPKIKELENQANEEYKKALTIFLKAHEVNPDDKATLENIKNIYFRFRSESPEMTKLYDEYKEKWDKAN